MTPDHSPLRNLLATGAKPQLLDFLDRTAHLAACHQRRRQTVSLTCLAGVLAAVRAAARDAGVTLQAVVRGDGPESYPVLVGDSDRGWPPGPGYPDGKPDETHVVQRELF